MAAASIGYKSRNLYAVDRQDLSTSSHSEIRCRIRKKNVAFSPEEEVRQRLLDYMVNTLHYPAGRIAVEVAVKVNRMAKRADVIVYDEMGGPWLVVECKRPAEVLNQKVVSQIAMYNHSLNAPYLVLTNGKESYILAIDPQEQSIRHLTTFPIYNV